MTATFGPITGGGGIAQGLMQQASPPPRQPEIQLAAVNLNERVDTLTKELSILEQRLAAILRPQPPSPQVNQATQAYGCVTQLGQSIAQATGNIDVNINRVRGMLDLLEL